MTTGTQRQSLGALLANLLIGACAGVFLFILLILVATLLVDVMRPLERSFRLWAALALLAALAAGVGLALGLWRGRGGWTAGTVAGATMALILFLLRLNMAPGETFNPLVFGWPGMVVAFALTSAGSAIALLRTGRRRRRRISPLANLLAGGSGLWIAGEVTARAAGGIGLGTLLGNILTGDLLAIALTFPLLAWGIAYWGVRRGIDPTGWDYDRRGRPLLFGLLAGGLIVALLFVTQAIDAALFASEAGEAIGSGLDDNLVAGGPALAALLLAVNGILVPVSEELAWRAVLQTAAMRLLSALWGWLLIAFLFALKHVIVDGSFFRFTSLLMFALVVGGVRQHWGSAASTVAHLTANLAATAIVIGNAL